LATRIDEFRGQGAAFTFTGDFFLDEVLREGEETNCSPSIKAGGG